MDSTPFLLYAFQNPRHYENINKYKPSNEFIDIARNLFIQNDGWTISTAGFWTNAKPKEWVGPKSGWKIHVSSTQKNAEETLKIVASVLKERQVAFKFCSDRKLLRLSMSKNWSRVQTGKFITIYPESEKDFVALAEMIHEKTRHLKGPYILTDRPYKDSRCVFYRYGAFGRDALVDVYGRKIYGFYDAGGNWQKDVRGTSFRLPDGIKDPIKESSNETNEKRSGPIILNEKYRIDGALKFNATGGIYFGLDLVTGREIVIRELRGSLADEVEERKPGGNLYLLEKEARILKKLNNTGLTPKFIDLFQAWEHWFLVTERLDAVSLWGKSMEFYFLEDDEEKLLGPEKMISAMLRIAKGVNVIHEQGIILRDLTKNNILFTRGNDEIKFIDFEFSYEIGEDSHWERAWTPGYASKNQIASRQPAKEDDHYSLGVLMLDILTFCAAGMDLDRASVLNKLKFIISELNFPDALVDVIYGLLEEDPGDRLDIDQAIGLLEGIKNEVGVSVAVDLWNKQRDEGTAKKIKTLEIEIGKYIEGNADFDREDRLWPASAELFVTNPFSIQYGAVGTAWFLYRSQGCITKNIVDWLSRKSMDECPAGLYAGRGGYALFLLDIGDIENAEKILAGIDWLQLSSCCGLYFGLSGLGLIYLHFWKKTKKDHYLQAAINIADYILAQAKRSEQGTYWLFNGQVFLGFGDGQSGIALFLTYMGAATGRRDFVDLAGSALDFDLANATYVSGRVAWKTHIKAASHAPNLPHARFGSAGVGAACIRYFSLTKKEKYKNAAIECAQALNIRISSKIWQDEGASGYGEFFLDMAQFLGETAYCDIAFLHAESIAHHAIYGHGGVAFAGTEHYRISCDYSAGSAGIGIFFNRLNNDKHRFLLLDEIIL